MTTICLSMIVKNEAHVIRRCLDSVRPFVDSWVIVDTGSTDGTQDIIRDHFANVPGILHERPWKDFGHNRSEALALARAFGDYSFVIDADDELVIMPGFKKPELTADAYAILIRDAALEYRRTCLFSNRVGWRYVGVLHEYPEAGVPTVVQQFDAIHILRRVEGGRSAIGFAEKYRKDAEILERALEAEPDNARYAFYLAQSYRDAGRLEDSLNSYLRRSEMGGWEEEVWCALFEAAKLSERLRLEPGQILDRYLKAYEARPKRAETLVELARWLRENRRYELAHLFAQKAVAIPKTSDILFVDQAAYEWRALDEYAIASYWVGRFKDSLDACRKLLAGKSLPDGERARVSENANFARAAIAARRGVG